MELKPRGLKLKEAATYVGLSVNGYRNAVKKGILPGPIPGTSIYDLHKIDEAFDQLSGIIKKEKSSLDPYEQWLASQDED